MGIEGRQEEGRNRCFEAQDCRLRCVMGLSAFNAMRARKKAREEADKVVVPTVSFPELPSVENQETKKKTDAEKLKKKRD